MCQGEKNIRVSGPLHSVLLLPLFDMAGEKSRGLCGQEGVESGTVTGSCEGRVEKFVDRGV